MAMTIAWQILNKITYPKDLRFSKNVLVVSPNITVKDRLSVYTLIIRIIIFSIIILLTQIPGKNLI